MAETLRLSIPTDVPVTSMMTDALSVLVFTFGDNMACAAEEKNLDRLMVQVNYKALEGPGAGRRFRLEFSLEPEGDIISTH